MRAAIDQFNVNIARARNLGSIAAALSAQTTGALDLSDIWRAELVLAVSALDHYVHELTRLGILDIYRGNRLPPPGFERFRVSITSALHGIADPGKDGWLEQ